MQFFKYMKCFLSGNYKFSYICILEINFKKFLIFKSLLIVQKSLNYFRVLQI